MSADAKAIFLDAIEEADAARRRALLDEACAGDAALRSRVDELIASFDAAGSFLDKKPGAEIAATVEQIPGFLENPGICPGTQIGPYKLREQIGEGGFGVVYVAEQEKPVARKVALKIIKPGMDTRDVIARFEAERQALALMDHPNIAKVLDAGTTGERDSGEPGASATGAHDPRTPVAHAPGSPGRPYFVMELVRGVPITEFCDERKLNTRERLQLFIDVCRAVQHAHQKGIIHRDLKPSNVMVTLHDDKPVVKVIDFGVAKALSSKLTEKTVYTAYGQMVGTPLYMSPEQAELSGLDVETRSDVYSLGVLLYELLTGTTPFDKETLQKSGFDEMRRIIREVDPPRPSARISTLRAEMLSTVSDKRKIDPRRLSASLRGELDWIVMKALEKDRNRRYESASSFAADVERYLADEPVLARPASVWYRFRKFARRKKAALAFGSLVLLFVVTLGVGAGWVVRDRAARENAAERERENRSQQLADRVAFVLAEVGRHKKSQDWAAAREANKRAQSLLSGSDGHQDLKARIQRHQRELDLVAQLRGVRENQQPTDGPDERLRAAKRSDAAYSVVFRKFGIDMARLSHKEAVRKLGNLAEILPVVFTTLDHWATSRKRQRDRQGARRLRELAIAVDSDAWRNKLRQALMRRDRAALQKLATKKDVLDQPAYNIWLLAVNLTARRAGAEERQLGVDLLRRAVRRYPRDFWLNYSAGSVLANEEPKEALAYLHAAHALRPRAYGAIHNLANAWWLAGFPELAIAQWQEYSRKHPQFWWPHRGIADVCFQQRDFEQALIHYQRAINCKPPGSQIPRMLHRIDRILRVDLKQPERAIALFKNTIRDQLRQNAEADFENNELRQTISFLFMAARLTKTDVLPFFRELVDDYPRSSIAHHALAQALTGRGKGTGLPYVWTRNRRRLREAREHIQIACRLRPKSLRFRFALEEIVQRLGDPPGPVALWKEAVEANPTATTHLQLARACMASERWNEAFENLRIAQQKEPRNRGVLRPLSSLISDCPDRTLRRPHAALRFARYCRGNRSDWEDNERVALAHFRLGQWEQVVELMKQVEDDYDPPHNGPPFPDVFEGKLLSRYYVLAIAEWKRDRKSEALDWFLKAILPGQFTNSEYRYPRRFHCEAVAVIPPDAIVAECTRRLELGDAPPLYFARGEAHARLKHDDKAAADFAKALSLVKPEKGWKARRRVVSQRLAEFPNVVEGVARLRPTDPSIWIEVGRFHAAFGRWKEAADAYGKVVDHPAAFKTTNVLRWSVEFAGVLLLKGDQAGYQQLCRKVADSFDHAEHIDQKTTLAGAVTLGAESGFKPSQLTGWAGDAMSSVTRGGSWQAEILGMARYRSGDFRKAVEALEDANIRRGKPAAGTAFGMALAYHKLGDRKESRRWYDFAVRLHTDLRPNSSVPTRQLSLENWIAANVRYQEAKALIEGTRAKSETN